MFRTLSSKLGLTLATAIALALLSWPLHNNGGVSAAPPQLKPPLVMPERPGLRAERPSGRIKPGEIIVKFRRDVTREAAQASAKSLGLSLDDIEGVPAFVLRVPAGREMDHVAKFAARGDVEYAQPNYVYEAFWTPNDEYLSSYQWNLSKINMPTAWNYTRGNAAIKVAVVDTGIDAGHPDRPRNLVLDYDYIDNDWYPQDEHGHGTHVAGIIAANTNNGTGVAGVAPDITIIVLRGLDASGLGYTSTLAQAVRRAADLGARVINMSWGASYDDPTLREAIDYAYSKGTLPVAAAGNAGTNAPLYPAYYSNVIAAGATDSQDNKASFSTWGDWVDVGAPGSTILSTWPGGYYAWLSGTSMSAPHVSGLAALLLSLNPSLSNAQVRGMIENTTVAIPGNPFAHGRIDAAAAVACAAAPLQFTPVELVFLLDPAGPDTQSQNISLTGRCYTQLAWFASRASNASWLQFSPMFGTTPSSLTVTVNKSGLAQGWYEEWIRVAVAGSEASPQDIRVRLYVGPVYRLRLPLVTKQAQFSP